MRSNRILNVTNYPLMVGLERNVGIRQGDPVPQLPLLRSLFFIHLASCSFFLLYLSGSERLDSTGWQLGCDWLPSAGSQ